MHPAPTEGLPQWPMILRHLKIGWWMLLGFLSCGIALEAMHGFKMDIYLNVDHQTRRMMWTLMHGFGAILGLAHIAFAASLRLAGSLESPPAANVGNGSTAAIASACLKSASILLPIAFFLGGLSASGQTMPLGLLLAAPGIALLLITALLTAHRVMGDT